MKKKRFQAVTWNYQHLCLQKSSNSQIVSTYTFKSTTHTNLFPRCTSKDIELIHYCPRSHLKKKNVKIVKKRCQKTFVNTATTPYQYQQISRASESVKRAEKTWKKSARKMLAGIWQQKCHGGFLYSMNTLSKRCRE